MTQTTTATPIPTPRAQTVVCPYCGQIEPASARCGRCGGRFDPLSRQASQNAMGPWFVLDRSGISRPGCSYDIVRELVARGQITPDSVVRGPSTRQFWALARHTPGVAHLLGRCHNCAAECSGANYACPSCGAAFEVDRDRQHLGLGPIRPIPGVTTPTRPIEAPPPAPGGAGPIVQARATQAVPPTAMPETDGPSAPRAGVAPLPQPALPRVGSGVHVPEPFRPHRSAWPAIMAAGLCVLMAAAFATYVAAARSNAARTTKAAAPVVGGGAIEQSSQPTAVPLEAEPISPAELTLEAARLALASEDVAEVAAAIAAVEALSPQPPGAPGVLEALRARLETLLLRSAPQAP